MSDQKEREALIKSDTTQRTNKLLSIISQITGTVMDLPHGEDYKYKLTMNTDTKQKVKKCNKRIAKMLSRLMVKTTREKDNHEEYGALTSKQLLKKYHYVVDTSDDLLEVANKNIDRYIKE